MATDTFTLLKFYVELKQLNQAKISNKSDFILDSLYDHMM